MDSHPLDRPIASDLFQLVLEKRRREVQAVPQTLDSTNQRLHSGCVFDAYIADRTAVGDSYQGEGFKGQRLIFRG